MGVLQRNNVKLSGQPAGQPMLFAHGFGCDQNMWRFVAPAFEDRFRVVLFDHVGAGRSDLSAYDRNKYESLQGYASDVLETLVLQCSEDAIAPRPVGEYVHRQIPDSELVVMQATGHCPNLSSPEETIAAIQAFV